MAFNRKVECDSHGETTGYLVCLCIAERGQTVDPTYNMEPGDPEGLVYVGQRLCVRCGTLEDLPIANLVLVCHSCACERGWATTAPAEQVVN